jgi:DNA invertase Pin-like site-specific DNA recombinase
MSLIGYARVSTPDQHLDQQVASLGSEGAVPTYSALTRRSVVPTITHVSRRP